MEIELPYVKRYRIWGITTIALVFFLIFVGGLVRSTGSGMGCPDWPKCFGQWIPPTDVSQLPPDYKSAFAVAGKEIADFDVFKTWTEYINRLIGVFIGFAVFLTLIFAIPYLKTKPAIFWLSLLSFILVGFQGWIGSVVVSTDLATYMVTIHMLLALLIVALLIYTISLSQDFEIPVNKITQRIKWLSVLLLAIILIQIITGTQVREEIDLIAKRIDNRLQWVNELGLVFKIHRSLSWLTLITVTGLIFEIRKMVEINSLLHKAALALLIITSSQIFCGAALANLGFAKALQSIHLTLGSITAGIQIFITILVFNKLKTVTQISEQ